MVGASPATSRPTRLDADRLPQRRARSPRCRDRDHDRSSRCSCRDRGLACCVERIAYRPLRNAPAPRAAHQRHRRVVLPAVHRCAASSARASTPTRPSTFLDEPVGLPSRVLSMRWVDVARHRLGPRDDGRPLPVRDAHQAGHRHPGRLRGQGHRRPHGHRRQPRHRHDVRDRRGDGRRGRRAVRAGVPPGRTSRSGFIPGIKAFTAAVLGGIGNIPGAMLGGLFLGEIESVGPTLFLDGLRRAVAQPAQGRDRLHDAGRWSSSSGRRASSVSGSRGRGHDAPRADADGRPRRAGRARHGPGSRSSSGSALIGGGVAHLPVPRRASCRSFDERPLIDGRHHARPGGPPPRPFVGAGYVAARRVAGGSRVRPSSARRARRRSSPGPFLTVLVLVGSVVDLRAVFLNASPDLYDLLTIEHAARRGLLGPGRWSASVLGAHRGRARRCCRGPARPLLVGSRWPCSSSGLFAGLLRTPHARRPAVADLARFLFASEGLTPIGARSSSSSPSSASCCCVRARRDRRSASAMLPARAAQAARHPAVVVLLLIVLLFPLGARPVLRPGHRARRALHPAWASASTSRSAWPACSTSASWPSSPSAPTPSAC